MSVRIEFPNLEEELAKVRLQHGGGVYASASLHYREAIFGRDSLEAAEDVLAFKPEIAREVLLTLASLQGEGFNPQTEEEPGKIHHEYRALVMDGRKVSDYGQKLLAHLSEWWGGSAERLVYYGSVDSTPLFVRLAVRYCLQEGDEILDTPVERLDGTTVIFRQSVMAALRWLEAKMSASPWGLVTFNRTNSHGHTYQVWKDGSSSYLHLDGRRANFTRPMAAIEVQGYTYDALLGASELGLSLTHDELLSRRWASLAKQLRQRTIEHFWMPKQRFWAQAIDEDPLGNPRQVATLTSNAGLILESRLLDDLPLTERQLYVEPTVERLYSDDFVTNVGIRCRAWQHHELVDYADYHGSWAIWAKETFDLAKGFRRHGLPELADQLELRILNGVRLSGCCAEFWYVNGRGQVDYDPQEHHAFDGERTRLIGTHVAEDTQTWTISAALAIEARRQAHEVITQLPWQQHLENRLLENQKRVSLLDSEQQAAEAYPTGYAFHIDLEEGKRRRSLLIERPLA